MEVVSRLLVLDQARQCGYTEAVLFLCKVLGIKEPKVPDTDTIQNRRTTMITNIEPGSVIHEQLEHRDRIPCVDG
jgi:hypothetical protein